MITFHCDCFVTVSMIYCAYKAVNHIQTGNNRIIRKEKIMQEVELSSKELEGVAGGDSIQDTKYNLSYYAYKTVSVPMGTLLVMQEAPGGAFMSTYYSNGDSIFVNMRYAENGYLLAYKNGVYGYVDMKYVNL